MTFSIYGFHHYLPTCQLLVCISVVFMNNCDTDNWWTNLPINKSVTILRGKLSFCFHTQCVCGVYMRVREICVSQIEHILNDQNLVVWFHSK